MRKQKNIKPVKYAQVVNTIDKYQALIKKQPSLQFKEVDEFIKAVSPFLTKKGTLRKGLSNKKIQQFNKLVTELKHKKLNTIKGIKNSNNRRENTLVNKNYLATKEDAHTVTELLETKLSQKLMNKGYLDIYNLMDIAETDYTDDVSNIDKVIEYTLNELEGTLPEDILDLMDEDDDVKLFNEYKNNKAKEFKTRNMFRTWLQLNYARFKRKKVFKNKTFSDLSEDDLEQEYQNYLKGKYNVYL